LQALLGINGFSGYTAGAEWPREVNDTVTATVLGLCAWLLIWPASLMHLLVMVMREAALLVLAATSPIAAGGLMSESGRSWFWKSLRWFVAALLIAPLSALVLGVGHRIAEGVVSGAGDETAAAVGMAVVGSVLILVGAVCPLLLFRLLAFVDPGTSSGAAMRAALSGEGGFSGLLRGGGDSGGSAASRADDLGRSAGETTADAATASRFAATGSTAVAAVSVAGAAIGVVGKVAHSAIGVGSDVLSSSGVGHSHPYYPPLAPAYRSAPRPRQADEGARPTERTPDSDPDGTDVR
jgi:hypothetical protein